MKNICEQPELNQKLLLYLEGLLKQDEKKAVAAHIKECSLCSDELTQLKEIDVSLKTHKSMLTEQSRLEACIPSELLVEYAGEQKNLTSTQKDAFKLHISTCSICKEHYGLLIELQRELAQPRAAGDPVRGEQMFLDMASEEYGLEKPVKQDTVKQLFKTLTDLFVQCREFFADLFMPPLQPQTVSLRKGKRELNEHIKIIKDFSKGITVKIEAEEVEEKNVELWVFLTSTGNKISLVDIRASLFQDGEELVSLIAENGRVLFKNIPGGTYHLVLYSKGKEIKKIQFTLR